MIATKINNLLRSILVATKKNTAMFGVSKIGLASSIVTVGVLIAPEVLAASSIVSSTSSGSSVEPAEYNLMLETDDPLSVPVNVTVPAAPNSLDLFLLEDLSGSFGDDLFTIKSFAPDLVDSITAISSDTQFGIGSYIDKPFSSFSSDYVYETNLALTSDTDLFQSALDELSASGGGDFPESQLEALLQTAVRGDTSEIGFRDDALSVVVLSTDADYHVAGDEPTLPANNGDAVLDGDPPGSGEDYPSVDQVKNALMEANIVPIFAVTSGVIDEYEGLVDEFGFGSVVELESDSSNLIEVISEGLDDVFSDITLTAMDDDFGYVSSISPNSFADVSSGDTRTFDVTFLSDGTGENDSLRLVAPGFGETLVNVDVGGMEFPVEPPIVQQPDEPPVDGIKTPEPTFLLSFLGVGLVGFYSKRSKVRELKK